MLTRTDLSVRCHMSNEERQCLSSLLNDSWKGIYVSQMKSDIQSVDQDKIGSRLLLWITSMVLEVKINAVKKILGIKQSMQFEKHQEKIKHRVIHADRLVIEANSKIMIMMTVEEVEFKWEMFRITVISEVVMYERGLIQFDDLSEGTSSAEFDHLDEYLDIDPFINGGNELYLLSNSETYTSNGQSITETIESGLLIVNHNERLLVFDPEDVPLNFCITRNEIVIDEILKNAEITPLTIE